MVYMLSICCCCYCCWQWWWWCPVNEKLDEIIYFNWNSCKLQSQDNGNYYQLGVDLFEQVMDEYKFVLMGLTCALQIQLNSRFHYMAILSCTSSTSKHAGCTRRQSESVPSIVIGFLSSYLGIGNYLPTYTGIAIGSTQLCSSPSSSSSTAAVYHRKDIVTWADDKIDSCIIII